MVDHQKSSRREWRQGQEKRSRRWPESEEDDDETGLRVKMRCKVDVVVFADINPLPHDQSPLRLQLHCMRSHAFARSAPPLRAASEQRQASSEQLCSLAGLMSVSKNNVLPKQARGCESNLRPDRGGFGYHLAGSCRLCSAGLAARVGRPRQHAHVYYTLYMHGSCQPPCTSTLQHSISTSSLQRRGVTCPAAVVTMGRLGFFVSTQRRDSEPVTRPLATGNCLSVSSDPAH